MDLKIPKYLKDAPRLEKLNWLQEQCVNEAVSKMKSTVCIATGCGKSFVSFKFLYSLIDNGDITEKDEIWYLAETNTRERTLHEESNKFNEIYGEHPMEDLNIKFMCYQAKPVGEPKVIIADECHLCLTKEYSKAFDNPHDYCLGLSATIPYSLPIDSAQAQFTDPKKLPTKGELLGRIAPVCVNYPLDQAIKDGILSPFNTVVIDHVLDSKVKNLMQGNAKKQWMSTEKEYYDYRMKCMRNPGLNKFYKANKIREASKLLWNLPSKRDPALGLMRQLQGKTIIFSNELNMLQMLLPDTQIVAGGKGPLVTKVNSKGKKVNSRQTKSTAENNAIIDAFNKGEIQFIGSAKKLKQGITLEGVENCIIMSYYKEFHHVLQSLGRVVRFVPGKIATLYIFRTLDTFEEKWFKQINEQKDSKGKIIKTYDLNIKEVIYSKNLLL